MHAWWRWVTVGVTTKQQHSARTGRVEPDSVLVVAGIAHAEIEVAGSTVMLSDEVRAGEPVLVCVLFMEDFEGSGRRWWQRLAAAVVLRLRLRAAVWCVV